MYESLDFCPSSLHIFPSTCTPLLVVILSLLGLPRWESTQHFHKTQHRVRINKSNVYSCSAESEESGLACVQNIWVYIYFCLCVSVRVCMQGGIIHHSYQHHLSPTRRQRKKAPGKQRHSKQNGEEMKRNNESSISLSTHKL